MSTMFNKKKRDDSTIMLLNNDMNIMRLMNEHLELIEELVKEDGGILDIVIKQQKAISDLQSQVETLQKLINQTES